MRRSRYETASSRHEQTCGPMAWRCTRCSHSVKTHSCPRWRSTVLTKRCCWLIWRRACDCLNPRPVRWRSTPPSCIHAGGSSPVNGPPSSKLLKAFSSSEGLFVLGHNNTLLALTFDIFISMWRFLLKRDLLVQVGSVFGHIQKTNEIGSLRIKQTIRLVSWSILTRLTLWVWIWSLPGTFYL